MLLQVLHLLLTRLSNQGWIQPSSFDIVPVLSFTDRIQLLHNLSTLTPPSAPLQYLVVKSKGLTCVPLAKCRQLVAEDVRRSRNPDPLDFWIPSTRLAICGLFVRKLTRSPSCLSLASPCAWKTSCLHSKPHHARKRELRCVATEIVQEPGSSPALLMVQDCTELYAPAISNDKLRVLIADQPLYFALIFSIIEVPPFALLRSGSKVKNATVHIGQEVVFLPVADVAATSLPVHMILTFVVTQHSPRLSESCGSRSLLRQILRRLFVAPATSLTVLLILAFFVSPSVIDLPFFFISAANNGLASLRNVTQIRCALRVVGTEQISSGTTLNSHPFLCGLHPSSLSSPSRTLILTLFVSLSYPSDFLGLLLSLSGSPMSASSLCSLGGWSTLTLGSAGAW